jgi:hypothetical protein
MKEFLLFSFPIFFPDGAFFVCKSVSFQPKPHKKTMAPSDKEKVDITFAQMNALMVVNTLVAGFAAAAEKGTPANTLMSMALSLSLTSLGLCIYCELDHI